MTEKQQAEATLGALAGEREFIVRSYCLVCVKLDDVVAHTARAAAEQCQPGGRRWDEVMTYMPRDDGVYYFCDEMSGWFVERIEDGEYVDAVDFPSECSGAASMLAEIVEEWHGKRNPQKLKKLLGWAKAYVENML